MTQHRANPDIMKYKYDRGICTNPAIVLQHNGPQLTYTLIVANSNTGWLMGYSLCIHDAPGSVLIVPCKNGTEFFFNRKLAMIAAAEFAWQYFKGFPHPPEPWNPESDDLQPLKGFITDLGGSAPMDHTNDTERYVRAELKDGFSITLPNPKSKQMAKSTGDGIAPKKETGKLKAIKKDDTEISQVNVYQPDIIAIESATIKDAYCNYKYIIIEGSQPGFGHSVNGPGIIDETLQHAFARLNVHLACIDDAFKLSGIEIKKIDKMHNTELAHNYHVSAFKITGEQENMSVTLSGDKFISIGGRIPFSTPKIVLDNLSGYKFTEELKDAIDLCCREVIEYHQGKYTIVEDTPDLDDESGEQLALNIPNADSMVEEGL